MKTGLLLFVLITLFPLAVVQANEANIKTSRPQSAVLYRDGYAVLTETIATFVPGTAIRLSVQTDLSSLQVHIDGELVSNIHLEKILETEAKTVKTVLAGNLVGEEVATVERHVGYLLLLGANRRGQLTLRYGSLGISWQPQLGVEIINSGQVRVSLSALVNNQAIDLNDCQIRLASSAGQMPSKEYFAAATRYGYRPAGHVNHRSADLIYPAGRQNIKKDRASVLSVLSTEARFQNKLVWHTNTRERVQSVMLIANPFPQALCPTSASLWRDGVLLGQDKTEWTPPGANIIMSAGHASDIEIERSVDTIENRAKRPRPFRHVIEFRVSNRSKQPVYLETVMPKMIGHKHKTLYHFKRAPDQRPGKLFIWNLNLKAGQTEVIRFHFDSELARFPSYQNLEKARMEMF